MKFFWFFYFQNSSRSLLSSLGLKTAACFRLCLKVAFLSVMYNILSLTSTLYWKGNSSGSFLFRLWFFYNLGQLRLEILVPAVFNNSIVLDYLWNVIRGILSSLSTLCWQRNSCGTLLSSLGLLRAFVFFKCHLLYSSSGSTSYWERNSSESFLDYDSSITLFSYVSKFLYLSVFSHSILLEPLLLGIHDIFSSMSTL